MSYIRPLFPRRATGLERSLSRTWRAEQADAVCRGLLRLSYTAEPPMRHRLTDMAYAEGAKADVLRALADGHYREARSALACWRALHRSLMAHASQSFHSSAKGNSYVR